MWSKLKAHDKFRLMWDEHGYGNKDDCEEEFVFHPGRAWRFDFAWPALRVAVEIHGFGWGHQAQQHLARDSEKIRDAILSDWVVVPFTTRCIASRVRCREGVELVCRVLENRWRREQ